MNSVFAGFGMKCISGGGGFGGGICKRRVSNHDDCIDWSSHLQQSLLQLFPQGQLGSCLSLLLSLRVLLGLVDRRLGVPLPSGGVVVGSHLTEHSRVHPGSCQQGGVIEGSVRLGVLRLKTQ